MLNIKITYQIGSGPWKKRVMLPTEILGYASPSITFGLMGDFPNYEFFEAALRNGLREKEKANLSEKIVIGNVEFSGP